VVWIAAACLSCGGKIVLEVMILRHWVAVWKFEVKDGWDVILFPKIRFTTTGKGMDVSGTFRCPLKGRGMTLVVLREIGEEEGDEEGIMMILIVLVVAVGASTMKHLARCTWYAASTRLGARFAGTRGDRGSTVTAESLTKKDLRTR
jgi:hypothetical protein